MRIALHHHGAFLTVTFRETRSSWPGEGGTGLRPLRGHGSPTTGQRPSRTGSPPTDSVPLARRSPGSDPSGTVMPGDPESSFAVSQHGPVLPLRSREASQESDLRVEETSVARGRRTSGSIRTGRWASLTAVLRKPAPLPSTGRTGLTYPSAWETVGRRVLATTIPGEGSPPEVPSIRPPSGECTRSRNGTTTSGSPCMKASGAAATLRYGRSAPDAGEPAAGRWTAGSVDRASDPRKAVALCLQFELVEDPERKALDIEPSVGQAGVHLTEHLRGHLHRRGFRE